MNLEVGTHPCNEEDYKKFYPPSIGTKKKFEFFKNKNAIICMDEEDAKGNKLPRTIFG